MNNLNITFDRDTPREVKREYYRFFHKLKGKTIRYDKHIKKYRVILSKKEEEYQRYKYACVKNHMDCTKINNLKNLEQIKSCQARCQYSYDS
ncbi:hypothetical protein LCGC14_2863310 [marine sediment metagenome]|uniref:Uncharacterized protein n=1 Tax=marine sediment metagenome TaxID=412755 RepID=A0A0F8Y4Z2_9ZZZZ